MTGLLSEGIERIVPWWVARRPGLEHAYKVLWSSAVLCDALIHAMIEGVQASWPGVGTPTALGEIGVTRGIVRGLSDTHEEYAARLRGWLSSWGRCGSDEEIARQLRAYLAGRPMVRVVDRHGQWTEVDATGAVRTFSAPWDWDSLTHPTAAVDRPTDIWIIVYGSYTHQPSWAELDDSHGIGHVAPYTEVDQAIAILKTWKPSHNWIRCVIWVDTPAELDPEASVGLPDGRWGLWSKDVANVRVAARNPAFRFWEFEQ